MFLYKIVDDDVLSRNAWPNKLLCCLSVAAPAGTLLRGASWDTSAGDLYVTATG